MILSARYAKAYVGVFKNHLAKDDIIVFKNAALFFATKNALTFFLETSLLTSDYKKKQLERLTATCKLPLSFSVLLELLISHKRVGLLPRVCRNISFLLKEIYKTADCSVKSSSPLSPELREQLDIFLHTATGKDIVFDYTVDPLLIAGIRCQTEQLLWENSLQKKLRALENTLKV